MVHLYNGTFVSPIFPLLSYKWGAHYRTDGGTLLLCNAEGYKPRGLGGSAPLSMGVQRSTFPLCFLTRAHTWAHHPRSRLDKSALCSSEGVRFLIILLSLCTRLCTLRRLGDYYGLYTSNYRNLSNNGTCKLSTKHHLTQRQRPMAITEVTLRDFRKDLSSLLDQVDEGISIVLSRGGNRRYTILPVQDSDLDFTPEMYQAIDQAMEEIQRGECTRVKGVSGVLDYLNQL